MRKFTKFALVFSACIVAAAGFAVARMKAASPPGGPMEGSTREQTRTEGRFLAAFDLNHDGKVTRDEMSKAGGSRFSAIARGAAAITPAQFASLRLQQSREHVGQMFRRLDWNGDGRLSFEEYAGPLRVRFQTMDREGKGTESCAFKSTGHGGATSKSSVRGGGKARFCSEHDLNHDGVVTHAEFDAVTAKRFKMLTAGTMQMTAAQFESDTLARYNEASGRMFKRLDTNRDGTLSLNEFTASDWKRFSRMDRNRDGVVTKDELAPGRIGFSRRKPAERM